MDEIALQFQQQLHDQNQDRFRKLEALQLAQSATLASQSLSLARIEANTTQLPRLVERIESLESTRDRARGIVASMVALGTLLGTALGAFIEWCLHKFFR